MVRKTIDTKEDKVAKFLTSMANMKHGEVISPSTFARNSGLHPKTAEELNDMFSSAKPIGWKTERGLDGKARLYIRTDDELELRNEIRDLRKETIDLKKSMDEIKILIKKKK